MLTTDFSDELIQDVWGYWRLSQTVVLPAAGNRVYMGKYGRMKWTSDVLHKKYPHISKMSFYKYLDRELNQ